jgi:hypothetical protein
MEGEPHATVSRRGTSTVVSPIELFLDERSLTSPLEIRIHPHLLKPFQLELYRPR